jgi:hypothetical protein
MKVKARRAEALFLALMAPLLWPPSSIAQQLRHTPATVNLSPTINLLFVDIHADSSTSNDLSLTPGIKRSQPHVRIKFLASGKGKLPNGPFAAPDGTERANAALLRNAWSTRPMQIERSLTPLADHRFDVAHLPATESERWQRFPALYQEDTPFASQVRMPLVELWGGRLQLDGFYREISSENVFRGLPQSSGVWWATPGNLTPRSATSYGIHLSFRCRKFG